LFEDSNKWQNSEIIVKNDVLPSAPSQKSTRNDGWGQTSKNPKTSSERWGELIKNPLTHTWEKG